MTRRAAPTVLLWDIDGTLLSTGRAGVFALEAAGLAVCGHEPDLSALPTAGLTDAQIAELVIESLGHEPSPANVAAFLAVYERELPGCLPRRAGHVMPGVTEILADLGGDPGVECLLLTGNTRAGAAAKLGYYGLAQYFDGGAFCVGPGPRGDIARNAWGLVLERAPDADPARAFVIGDTPHDVSCGREIGVLTIAIATGGHPLDELEACAPTFALPRLPDPPAFRTLIGVV